jgi:hypothetical protein
MASSTASLPVALSSVLDTIGHEASQDVHSSAHSTILSADFHFPGLSKTESQTIKRSIAQLIERISHQKDKPNGVASQSHSHQDGIKDVNHVVCKSCGNRVGHDSLTPDDVLVENNKIAKTRHPHHSNFLSKRLRWLLSRKSSLTVDHNATANGADFKLSPTTTISIPSNNPTPDTIVS